MFEIIKQYVKNFKLLTRNVKKFSVNYEKKYLKNSV